MRNTLADKRDTLAMRVRPDGPNLVGELLCTSYDILREDSWGELRESWPFHQCSNLSTIDYRR